MLASQVYLCIPSRHPFSLRSNLISVIPSILRAAPHLFGLIFSERPLWFHIWVYELFSVNLDDLTKWWVLLCHFHTYLSLYFAVLWLFHGPLPGPMPWSAGPFSCPQIIYLSVLLLCVSPVTFSFLAECFFLCSQDPLSSFISHTHTNPPTHTPLHTN